jgi:class 3 adenylate cyclase
VRASTRYLDLSGDALAYQVVGQGPDLTTVLGLSSHVDLRWSVPSTRRTLEALAACARLITFDRRGAGASGRLGRERTPSWDDWVDDLSHVLDATGSTHSWLLGSLDGGPYALRFAARHPDRVAGLLLANTAARYLQDDSFPAGVTPESAAVVLAALRQGWGTEDLAGRVAVDDPEERAAAALLQRASATPGVAAAHFQRVLEVDLRGVASSIRVPTFVFHRAEHPFVPIELGRDLAARIPGATFVELPGDRGLFDGADHAEVVAHIAERVTGRPAAAPDHRRLAAVLFTDIVASTSTVESLGDARWRQVLDEHDAVCARHVVRHGGRVVKFTGDGSLAAFDHPGAAIDAALEIRQGLATQGIAVRAGIHFAEIETRGEDIAGIAVHVAQRIQAQAEVAEILVSQTVVDLTGGAGFVATPRGRRELRGITGEWELFSVDRSP